VDVDPPMVWAIVLPLASYVYVSVDVLSPVLSSRAIRSCGS